MIIINTKNYKTGKPLLALAKLIQKHLPQAYIAVPTADIHTIAHNTKLKVLAQHVDNKDIGRNTGFITPESIKAQGAVGTLLNHSEHHLHGDILKETLSRCNRLKLKTFVCVHDIAAAHLVKGWRPTAIAYEEPSLIASGKSVTSSHQRDIQEFVALLRNTDITAICGAGISSADDVRAARELGCQGVLMASAIANNPRPEKLLKQLSR
jgi:triosephosphate isomerase